MTEQVQHFSTLADFCAASNLAVPEHPLLHVFTKDQFGDDEAVECNSGDVAFSTDFYTIAVKKVIAGDVFYGRTTYDFTNGSMMFTAPGQELRYSGLIVSRDAIMILIHKDFLKGHEIRKAFKKYGFFSYAVNEALHLSPREESIVRGLMQGILAEYQTNQDEFSKELILSQIDTLLKYANRYYKRQFLNRADMASAIVSQFEEAIQQYFDAGSLDVVGMPRIEDIAGKMKMSARYLSDALKAQTGKSAQEHIHLYVMDEAKDLLLRPGSTVSEVAYQLGFEYPQYFSRLFKKKTGISPKQYRDQNAVH